MFDLSARKMSPPSMSTPQKIGPSTYFLESDKPLKGNYVPFLSNTRRVTLSDHQTSTDALYNANVQSRIKGGSSMANRASRFMKAVDDDLPGPCSYDPKRPGKRGLREIVGKGRVFNCRVPYSLHAKGLSIPTKLDENGYWIDENERLVKIPPSKYDSSLGPAYYGTPQTKCFNSERYKGCRWSLSRSKREDSLQNGHTPGPGTYNPEKLVRCTMNNPQDTFHRALARQFSFLPRFLEAQEMQKKKENYPAPCDYNPNINSFKPKPSVSIKPKPFLNAAPRFGSSIAKSAKQVTDNLTNKELKSDSGILGPGYYDVKYTSKDKKTFSLMKAPFGTLAVKGSFLTNKITPGPTTYNVLGPISSNLMRQKCRENPLVPFNRTEERTLSFLNKDQLFMPSSADYVVEPLWKQKRSADSYQFRSTSRRTMAFIKETDDANVATYNIIEPFRQNTIRHSHYHGHAPFHQTRIRGPLFPINFGPGPGDYRTEISLGGRGYLLNTTPRFVEECETPGPSTYKIHPKVNSSVFKANATYNLRLKEFVLRKKIRLPPQETYARWWKKTNKQKNLRWFYEYEMSLPKIKDYIKEEFDDTDY